jgi:hypothetical protein
MSKRGKQLLEAIDEQLYSYEGWIHQTESLISDARRTLDNHQRHQTTNRIPKYLKKVHRQEIRKQHDDLARLLRCHENNLQGYEPELGKLTENEAAVRRDLEKLHSLEREGGLLGHVYAAAGFRTGSAALSRDTVCPVSSLASDMARVRLTAPERKTHRPLRSL